MAHEINFDGLIGPTHNFAGLAHGNVASMANKGRVSDPRAAALQGLEKMKTLMRLGVRQAVIPPLCRPDFAQLASLGFTGPREKALERLSREPMELVTAFFSASSMWTANAATACPSADSGDGKVHVTVANLASKLHRSLEPPGTLAILRAIFADNRFFTVHDPIHAHPSLGDEGAANHTRLCASQGGPGIQLFVYGRAACASSRSAPSPRRFPARQTLEASQAVARLHGLSEERVVFAQQNPDAIDAGAFHNDVVAVGNENMLFYHEKAFLRERVVRRELSAKFSAIMAENSRAGEELKFLRVGATQVPLGDAVRSYLFNSQFLRLPNGKTLLLAPIECGENRRVRAYLSRIIGRPGSPIDEVGFVDLRQSMLNGGGPACLRLRVALTEQELLAVNQGVLLDEGLAARLEEWIRRHYRDRMTYRDLCDPSLPNEVEGALAELTGILKLGPVYPFQRSDRYLPSA